MQTVAEPFRPTERLILRVCILLMAVAFLVVLTSCGERDTIAPGHVASIACGSDGNVHAQASLYSGGTYTLNGSADNPFDEGFNLTLDGTKSWTLVVDSFAADGDFTGSAGPCVRPSTTTRHTYPSTTVKATTTTEVTPSTAATTTHPATSTTTPSSTSQATTTSSSTSTTTTPSSSSTTTLAPATTRPPITGPAIVTTTTVRPTTTTTTPKPSPPPPPAPAPLPPTR